MRLFLLVLLNLLCALVLRKFCRGLGTEMCSVLLAAIRHRSVRFSGRRSLARRPRIWEGTVFELVWERTPAAGNRCIHRGIQLLRWSKVLSSHPDIPGFVSICWGSPHQVSLIRLSASQLQHQIKICLLIFGPALQPLWPSGWDYVPV